MKNKTLMYVGIAVIGFLAYRHFTKKSKTPSGKGEIIPHTMEAIEEVDVTETPL
jgi:hypothetical protein